ncbi:unnamed protein product [Allacma fusca]|uniref:UDP-glucuronosyltransferase n=1 Tax=Allacma fusca TaxID=39272 RepID=A0A8J2NI40_9HEXA|nr:unnamed protein product [Allacma fusca]
MNRVTVIALVLILGQSNVFTEGAKIFFMIPLSSISEKQIYIPLIDTLAERGHEVVVASVTKSKYKSKNIREFVPCTYEQFVGSIFSDPIEARKQMGRYTSLSLTDHRFITNACEIVYNNREFQQILTEKFDLVIKNSFAGPCFNGAVYRLQAPFISFNTMIPVAEIFEQTGARLPASFVPFALGPSRSTGKMSLLARLENVLLDIHWALYTKYSYYPAMTQIYRKYLGQDIPSYEQIQKNVSLIFSNSHFVINSPVPVLPDVIEVGGMQCVPPKPIPKDIDDFLSGAKDGFIFFSLGSMINSEFFPEGKWLPQNDILAHPNIRLFMTHGGALSTQEAIYNGVPMVVMPICADQDINARFAEEKGFAITLEIADLSEEILLTAINKILMDGSYTQTAREAGTYFRDQPMTPLERAVYWTETIKYFVENVALFEIGASLLSCTIASRFF